MAARILIVTNGHLCRNPRPLKEANTLGRAGYDVTVLAVRNHRRAAALDVDLLASAQFRHVAVDMLPGYGTADATAFRRRLRLWIARWAAARLRLNTIYALGPAAELLRHARRLSADLTIVHTEAPFWVGTRLLRQGLSVAADFEDWHSEDLMPEDRARRPLTLIRRMERTLLAQSRFSTTTSNAMADALHARYGGPRAQVITNSFPLQPGPRGSPPGEPPVFFWFSQTLGRGRGLELFLAAWYKTQQPSRVVMLGEPYQAFDQTLVAALPGNLRSRLSFLEPVPPDMLPAIIARHDIGLALEPKLPANKDFTISNKVLQYLNAGLAVVASDTAGHREVLSRSPEAGVIVELHETTRLTRTLDALIEDRAGLARRQNTARNLAEATYCWEREEPRLLALVAQALSSRVPQVSADPG